MFLAVFCIFCEPGGKGKMAVVAGSAVGIGYWHWGLPLVS